MQKWLLTEPPAETDWIDTVTKNQHMERMTFLASLGMLKFLQNWQQWIVVVTTRDALTVLAHLYLVYVPPIKMKYFTPNLA